jgi:hypothetical protein
MGLFTAFNADEIRQNDSLYYAYRLKRNAARLNIPFETYIKLREGRIKALVLANPLFVNSKLQQRPLSASFQQYADLKPDYLCSQMILACRTLDQCVGKSNDIASPLFLASKTGHQPTAMNKAARALNKLAADTPSTTATDQETLRSFAKIRTRNTISAQRPPRR